MDGQHLSRAICEQSVLWSSSLAFGWATQGHVLKPLQVVCILEQVFFKDLSIYAASICGSLLLRSNYASPKGLKEPVDYLIRVVFKDIMYSILIHVLIITKTLNA